MHKKYSLSRRTDIPTPKVMISLTRFWQSDQTKAQIEEDVSA